MIAIKAENLSKAYQLGEIGTGTISRDLERWFARVRGKEDSFLQIGEMNNRAIKGISDIVWSLKDINFEIEQGDAVGIIGRNGAGKSTLLKVLSRVTSPTSGRITGNGRIASLLEVGTGFHPELTGRENIYLNGAILGMRKKEITRKFDEIVDFAGVERYIDTPVKRYSSGMYVRLAFAVAAHLESEILIVDEVLAVGDAEFQQKCLGKMNEVSKGDGRTLLFVSHNMGMIKSLCSNSMLLTNGLLTNFNKTNQIIAEYLSKAGSKNSVLNFDQLKRADKGYGKEFKFIACEAISEFSNASFLFGEELEFSIAMESIQKFQGINIGIRIEDDLNNALTGPRSSDQQVSFEINDKLQLNVRFPNFLLAPGNYHVTLTGIYKGTCLDQIERCMSFTIQNETASKAKPHSGSWGKIITTPYWEIQS